MKEREIGRDNSNDKKTIVRWRERERERERERKKERKRERERERERERHDGQIKSNQIK